MTDVQEPRRLREVPVRRLYRRTDRPRDTFYVPCLKVASRYDRFAGYFRAASLEAVADEGLQAFFANGGHIRMVVDADLTEQDVDEIRQGAELGGDVATREAVRRQVEQACLRAVLPGSDRLSLVATLVAAGLMDVKVAVMEGDDGLPLAPGHPARKVFHDKVGVLWDDEEDAVTFRGSLNETPAGWARNYEGFSVYPSWDLAVWEAYGRDLAEEFDRAWRQSRAEEWRFFDLPEAARQNLIRFADPDRDWEGYEFPDPGDRVVDPLVAEEPGDYDDEPPDEPPVEVAVEDVATIRAERWSGLRTATKTPWPHQDAAARAVCDALWPPDGGVGEFGRMFADEVGLGKTIEVGLVAREALSNRGARRVLILAPASVTRQWQEEMHDGFSLWMPLLDGDRLIWPDGSTSAVEGDPWRSSDLLIASSHLARLARHRQRVVDAGWDLLVVDEAHHARRSEAGKAGTANLLLRLLRSARDTVPVRRMVLATATPMQMHVHEAWELLATLGLPDEWDVDAFERYWGQLAGDRAHDDRDWPHLQRLVAATVDRWGIDPTVRETLEERAGVADAADIASWYDAAEPSWAGRWPRAKADLLVWWLSEQTPLRHLVHRASRELLRHYQHVGIIGRDVTIPTRDTDEEIVDLTPAEDRLYDRVETWISRHYQAAKDAKKPAHGFVMTTYRRRLTSSLAAIRVSLQRRAAALRVRRDDAQASLDLAALLDDDDRTAMEETRDDTATDGDREEVAGVEDELAEVDEFVADIDAVLDVDGKDAKYRELETLLRDTVIAGTHRTCIVFTQYTDTMDWLRNHLASTLGAKAVATYSGRGGELPAPEGGWRRATKKEVTVAFRAAATDDTNPLRILIGTDSMSEGLNLQTCDLLINYDLPWNFMRLEQRIGRIDRIGGPTTAYVRNLLIRDTVEERVYSGIVEDHQLFGVVVGPTGSITGDPAVVLAGAEGAISGAVFGDDDVEDALAQLREAATRARARALTSSTFEYTPLADHDPDDGPWQFDRGDILDRLRHALAARLPQPVPDGSWPIMTDLGKFHGVFDPERADTDPHASLLVWGSPAFDVLTRVQPQAKPRRDVPDGGTSEPLVEPPGSLFNP